MPFYRFLVHGCDPTLPGKEHGFYTTRHAYAANKEDAARKVRERLTQEFTSGVSARIWRAGPPALTIEDGWRIGLHQLWSAPNRGSTFYDNREDPVD